MSYLELCKVNVIKPSINFKIKIKITNNLDKEEDLLKSENITLNIDTHLDSLSEFNINNDHYVSFIEMFSKLKEAVYTGKNIDNVFG